MSLATRCDGPGCNTWTRTLLDGWVQVIELPCILEYDHAMDFCSWDCLLKYAATREPMTVVSP